MGVTGQAISREGTLPDKGGSQRLSQRGGPWRELKLSFYDFIKWRKRNLGLFSE